jgi:hypothetical protein
LLLLLVLVVVVVLLLLLILVLVGGGGGGAAAADAGADAGGHCCTIGLFEGKERLHSCVARRTWKAAAWGSKLVCAYLREDAGVLGVFRLCQSHVRGVSDVR